MPKNLVKALAFIATVAGVMLLAFVYTAGWLSPDRLTPQKIVNALQPPSGPALGYRRNHAKGLCFTGSFAANGQGATLSKAPFFATGTYPVVGRFNIAGADPHMPDALAPVRGLSLRMTAPDGQEWRSAMIDAPFFAASTPEAFYAFLKASSSKDPDAMKSYIGAHPEILPFITWAKTHARSDSWAGDTFNSVNSFRLIDASGTQRTVRWSLVATVAFVPLSADALAQQPPDFLADEMTQRVATSPAKWDLIVTLANPEDPTSDPTRTWPRDRTTVKVGTLIADKVEPEANGLCRDINYDPTVLPSGMTTSDDPFPAARSAAYRVSYDRRMKESKDYPHPASGDQP